jgi:hypothetical protein
MKREFQKVPFRKLRRIFSSPGDTYGCCLFRIQKYQKAFKNRILFSKELGLKRAPGDSPSGLEESTLQPLGRPNSRGADEPFNFLALSWQIGGGQRGEDFGF